MRLCLVASLFALVACSGTGDRGGLGASLLDGMGDSLGSKSGALSGNVATFDLGALHGTDEYYFMLTNSSGAAVTGVSITSSNPAFVVRPTSIDEIRSGSGMEVVPIVRISAEHGSKATGVGHAPLLNKGTNTADIEIQGTQSGKTVSLILKLTLDAKVLDIDLLADGKTVDLVGARVGSVTSALMADVPVFRLQAGQVSLRNTGNVEIEVRDFGPGTDTVTPKVDVLAVGAELKVDGWKFLKLCANTVADPARLDVRADGCAHMFVERGTPLPVDGGGVPFDASVDQNHAHDLGAVDQRVYDLGP